MRFPGPKTIRGQLTASLVLFELLALLFFAAVLVDQRDQSIHARALRRITSQTRNLADLSSYALSRNDLPGLQAAVDSLRNYPTISAVEATDLRGRTLAALGHAPTGLSGAERGFLGRVHGFEVVGQTGSGLEAVSPVWVNNSIVAYVWVQASPEQSDRQELLRALVWGGSAVVLACTLLATLIAGSLTASLSRLLAATRNLILRPEDTSAFPLPVRGNNEVANLTAALNMLVASVDEQRAGLNDTVALLDSMLANAPIGLAFFDRNGRFIRLNRFLAERGSLEPGSLLGRHIDEIFAPAPARLLNEAVRGVFELATPVSGLEISARDLLRPAGSGGSAAEELEPHPHPRGGTTWLATVYPVRTANASIRWAGMVLVDMTERLRAEHALRETEKLAMAGRLAASIAHEINNPLEAVTNLLYLLRHHGSLGAPEIEWTEAAQHQVARVSAITQQTLRFHRQSTRPILAPTAELLDSVLTLHQGRFLTLGVQLERRYRDAGELLCYAGELRQLYANLIGNALDAMMGSAQAGDSASREASNGAGLHGTTGADGPEHRLIVSVRRSHGWQDGGTPGVRVTIADTGAGMSPEVRQRIFEPFYTTKEATGTGLGLWVSAEIMAKHHVHLQIRSKLRGADRANGGTVFMLFFPETQVPLASPLSTEESQSPVAG